MSINHFGKVMGALFMTPLLPAANTGAATITFSKDIAPILYEHCVQCHHPNTTAPMSLIAYKDVRPWARAIREKVVAREMPPWGADPHYGKFQNDPHLTDQQIAMIADWSKNGAPEGDPKFVPKVPPSAEGWHIGIPDVVLEMEQPFDGVWLPRDILIHAGLTMAVGSVELSYRREFSHYRKAEVSTRIKVPKGPGQ